MPKIFLIKNRLHLQQQRLLESQKRSTEDAPALSPPGSPLSESQQHQSQPLPLIVCKSPSQPAAQQKPPPRASATDGKRDADGDSKSSSSPGPEGSRAATPGVGIGVAAGTNEGDVRPPTPVAKPAVSGDDKPHRFYSSLLGADLQHASNTSATVATQRAHVLTRAERKEYAGVATAPPPPPPPSAPPSEDSVSSPPPPPPGTGTPSAGAVPDAGITPPPPAAVERVSVIQRAPTSAPNNAPELGPEQDAPIDYHVPKKRDGTATEQDTSQIDDRRPRPRFQFLKGGRLPPLHIQHLLARHGTGTPRTAAAGHGHSSSRGSGGGGNSGGGGSSSGSGSSGGGLGGYSGGGGLGGGGGGVLGGGGGGGGSMNPGGGGGGHRGGSNMYGPNSPPTGSLPPFYESLKAGSLGGGAGSNGNGLGGVFAQHYANYSLLGPLAMDCDTGQQQHHHQQQQQQDMYNQQKQYSLLHNVYESYGINFKEEEEDELSEYVAAAVAAQQQEQQQQQQQNQQRQHVVPKVEGSVLPPVQLLGAPHHQFNVFSVEAAAAAAADQMVVDMVSGSVVDPLPFTATLAFASPAHDHNALIASLSDDLFLQRMSSPEADDTDAAMESTGNADAAGLLDDDSQGQQDVNGTSSNTNIPPPVEPSVDPFPEHCQNVLGLSTAAANNTGQRSFDTSRNFAAPSQFGKNGVSSSSYGNGENNASGNSVGYSPLPKERAELALHISSAASPPTDATSPAPDAVPHMQQLQIQVQMSQQQHIVQQHSSASSQLQLSPGLSSFTAGGGLELHSPGAVSLPSPASCSLDGAGSGPGSLSPPASISGGPSRRTANSSDANTVQTDISNIPSLQVRVNILQQRLGLPVEVPLEFVNGGHGIKNPLANHEMTPAVPGGRPSSRAAHVSNDSVERPSTNPDDPTRFTCRICAKTFSLQRLLNRHMKCHSDVKRYLCTFCGKGFNDTFDLKRHTRTHTGVRPYKCNLCEKSFTQRCSLESHCLKVHGVQHQYAYKERRTKMYVCEECGHTTSEPEVHYLHLKDNHPYSPALLKFYDKRHFKFTNANFANMLLQVRS